MPYITPERRQKFIEHAEAIAADAEVAGDLNYAITEIVHAYIRKKGARYANFNEVIGMLECAKLELYRRQVAVYEDDCIIKNGDTSAVYCPYVPTPDTKKEDKSEGYYGHFCYKVQSVIGAHPDYYKENCPESEIPTRNGGGESH